MPKSPTHLIIEQETIQLPVLPLRDIVVYPNMVLPLFVGRKKSINALQQAMLGDKQILLLAQKSSKKDEPDESDLYRLGTISTVLQLLKLPDGTVKVLVEGIRRGSVSSFSDGEDHLEAFVEVIAVKKPEKLRELDIMARSLMSQFEQYIKLNKKIPIEILTTLNSIEDLGRLADTIAAHLPIKIEEKQEILEELDLYKRLERLMAFQENEIDLLQIEKRIRGRVKRQMEKSQREYYLNEQLKAIQNELQDSTHELNEIEDFHDRLEKAGLAKEAKEKCLSDLKKLKAMPPMSAEATVIRNYLDWMLKVPWKKRAKIQFDLKEAQVLLDKEHYGLAKMKERILEYLAVQQRVKKLKGPILCLVGPPGVGKTSLGQSIADATGRSFIRISLGGVRDEAEIRGHRRTYIGSMPGKIIQQLSKAGNKNPLLMLDEVDKMSTDFRGDPASALLEVLDPEQNNAFNDHYLEVDYDLSEIMFVATANTLQIPPPLLDRMEVIRLPGYTEDEKLHIAMEHLIPKQVRQHGLNEEEIHFSEGAIDHTIRYYTREAGVRNLEREIAKICRKVVRELQSNSEMNSIHITQKGLDKYLGVKRYRYGLAEKYNQVGQVNGLAWTEVGGELLTIEASAIPGKGKSIYTGQLGEVMQESIKAALTVVRSRCSVLSIDPEFYDSMDIHVHVPEGATPKDGPSAGIGMCTALVSAITNIPVKCDVAMTGEITLRGEVLPIGGLKEKLIAARRGGIKLVIIPEENARELVEIPKNITKDLSIKPVKWIDEVLELALERMPTLDGVKTNEDDKKETLVRTLSKSKKTSKELPRDQTH